MILKKFDILLAAIFLLMILVCDKIYHILPIIKNLDAHMICYGVQFQSTLGYW